MSDDGEANERHMFQATYSGNLQLAIRNIVMSFDEGDLVRAFRGCETLRRLVPRLWKEIDDSIYDKINKKIIEVTNGHMQAANIDVRRTGVRTSIDSIKKNYAAKFFETIMTIMDAHQYLDMGWAPIATSDFEKLEKDAEEAE